jgi:hypothetical protein
MENIGTAAAECSFSVLPPCIQSSAYSPRSNDER